MTTQGSPKWDNALKAIRLFGGLFLLGYQVHTGNFHWLMLLTSLVLTGSVSVQVFISMVNLLLGGGLGGSSVQQSGSRPVRSGSEGRSSQGSENSSNDTE